MGGINIEAMIEDVMQSACEFWHELTGGEMVWIRTPALKPLDIFDRMEIASLSGVTFRG